MLYIVKTKHLDYFSRKITILVFIQALLSQHQDVAKKKERNKKLREIKSSPITKTV